MTRLHEGERQEVEHDSPLEIIERALISAHDVTSEDAERATEWLAELMRRDWAARVLDAFDPTWRTLSFGACWLVGANNRHLPDAPTTDRDAARHAAALAVYPELPADVRAELGECP